MSNYEYIKKSPLGISGAIYQVKRNLQNIGYICREDNDWLYFLEQNGLYPECAKFHQRDLESLKNEIEKYFK
ncbi:hypothetical protein [Cysteiniphilum sp. JM-1]|uniref:hypothetical protein n=1 Tax=Cysteiniphilum sp. JM-1 TaxID=2610891 RepID=UPI001247C9CA|nr:hypothetical protein [Cysteiniphilum sp. JM-1]